MAVGPMTARNFWQQLDHQTSDPQNPFARSTHFRSSYNSAPFTMHPSPVTRQSIYCTMRDRKGYGRSASAPVRHRATIMSLLSTNHIVNYPQQSSERIQTKTMSANEISSCGSDTLELEYRAPKRYVEKMTTMTPYTSQPAMYISNLSLEREVPKEHYINLEAQQEAAINKPVSSDYALTIENYT